MTPALITGKCGLCVFVYAALYVLLSHLIGSKVTVLFWVTTLITPPLWMVNKMFVKVYVVVFLLFYYSWQVCTLARYQTNTAQSHYSLFCEVWRSRSLWVKSKSFRRFTERCNSFSLEFCKCLVRLIVITLYCIKHNGYYNFNNFNNFLDAIHRLYRSSGQ